MNVLVVAPHPDDDVIGCGGSIALHRSLGHNVHVVYMTSGDAGSIKIPKKTLGDVREKEALAALRVLDVSQYTFFRLPDGYVSTDDNVLKRFIELIRETKPNVIYIPHEADAHRDHKRTHKIVAEAVRRAAYEAFQECKGKPWSVGTVLCYEVWTPIQSVTYVEDISPFMKKKLEALQKHASQIAIVPYDDLVAGLNRYRGGMTGKGTYCECFKILRAERVF
jgi:LmbE family N-acetylglucosaminyl deacetylase